MQFNAPPPKFGRAGPGKSTCPPPITAMAKARRTADLHEAAGVLAVLPGEGETLHAVMTGRYDLMRLLVCLVEQLGHVESMRIATLSFNARNVADMLGLLDGGNVGSLSLLCSAFFRDHNKELWRDCLNGFRDRGQRAAAARSYCKVVTLACADGRRFSMEGSANLRTNSNREQFALTHDAAVHDWHACWIDAAIAAHEGKK